MPSSSAISAADISSGIVGLSARRCHSDSLTTSTAVKGACTTCPTAEAIFSEDEVPEDQQEFIELNADLAEVWPNITEKKDALADAEEWDGVKDKLQHLER